MRRLIALLFLIFTLSGVAVAQQMSDDQVIQYVKSSQQMGKTQKQITTELMRRGVTKEQVERIQQKYEDSKSGNQQSNTQNQSRQRGQQNAEKKADANSLNHRNNTQQRTIKGLRTVNGRQMYRGDQMEITGDSLWIDGNNGGMYLEEEDPAQQIFGHNIFTNANLTFEPNVNVATPINYRLGPGDEVIIDVWGASETTIRQTISLRRDEGI